MPVTNIGPVELSNWLADAERGKPLLLDVREPWEFQTCRIENARLVPLRELPARLGELDPATETVVICHHGGRSMQAAMFLAGRGFDRVHNLAGGVDAWARSVDPSMPVY
ncbi:MAG TPA: rhodanese-like domain-containing protein [Burkholderiales bacterium]|nr:rhodanese-like domain-containing protein [Burkholderiales bacterium]